MAARYLITGGGSVTWTNADTGIWSATSGGATGASVPGVGDDVIMDGASGGGTVTLNYAPSVISITCGAFTGTFSDGGFGPTVQTFSGSGTGTRTFNFTGSWIITAAGTAWSIGTTTNCTLNASTSTLNFTNASASALTMLLGSLTYGNINVTASSGILALTNLVCAGNLNLTGYTGELEAHSYTIGGSVTLGTGMTTASSAATPMALNATSSKNFTSNGVTFNCPITLNGVGGTWVFQDALVMTQTLTLTNGTLNANNQAITVPNFSSSNANVRVIGMGTNTWNLTGTGTVWDVATSTNLTITPSTSTIKITDTSGTGVTFAGGGKTYANLWFARGTSNATNTITGANTYSDLKDDGSVAHTIVFPNATSTVSSWHITGTAGNVITLTRTGGAGTFTLALSGGGTVSTDYLSISNSAATPSNTWFAGLHSTDGGGNSGWIFNPPTAGNFLLVL